MAVEQGWLQIQTTVTCGLTEDQAERARTRAWPPLKDLRARLDATTKGGPGGPPAGFDVWVFEAGERATDPGGYDRRLGRFGTAAAGRLSDLLTGKKVKAVGVMWGVSIASLIDALEVYHPKPPRKDPPVAFVPLSGGPHRRPEHIAILNQSRRAPRQGCEC